ncbi:hypothetical protein [Variovorax sp. KK3]|uniref:hypothetical protein n=1 Tax=Variovorax sp. KK3 TaxID=1855728 RepID=UPI00097C5A60|nr:hypothetical protein [Variovorax sp. KK3]
MKRLVLLAACLAACGAAAQPACPANGRELPVEALYGRWEARIDGQPGIAQVRLERHPDYAGVRGTVTRGGGTKPATVAQLAGDVDDEGMLNIDESADGRAISGSWLGELQPGSCGKEFKGTWRNASDDSTHPFVLNKTGTWQ